MSARIWRARMGVLALTTALIASVLVVAVIRCMPVSIPRVESRGGFSFRDGDLIFISCAGRLCEVIEGVTSSPFSHVGMVDVRQGRHLVIEAFGPVGEVTLESYLERCRGRFTLMRPTGELAGRIDEIQDSMKKYYGLPYDSRYMWGDDEIYCTELVQKAVLEVTGLELAPLRRLGDLNWKPHEKYIAAIEGGVPLEREMLTPADMQRSEHLELVYTSIDLH